MARTTNDEAKIAAGTHKRCTKSGIVLPATPEFFYRDKSQKDGLSPWSKDAERAYNKAYRAGLKDAKATRKGDIPTNTRPGKARVTKFEKAMSGDRVKRGTHKARA